MIERQLVSAPGHQTTKVACYHQLNVAIYVHDRADIHEINTFHQNQWPQIVICECNRKLDSSRSESPRTMWLQY